MVTLCPRAWPRPDRGQDGLAFKSLYSKLKKGQGEGGRLSKERIFPIGRDELCHLFLSLGDQTSCLCLSLLGSALRTQRLRVSAKQVPLAAGQGGPRQLTL